MTTPANTAICPFCHSDDVTITRAHGATLSTCVSCEARALDGQWTSPRAVRAYRRAVAGVRTVFDE